MINAYGWTKEDEEARNLFAACAMHAMLMKDKTKYPEVEAISTYAFEVADEMMQAKDDETATREEMLRMMGKNVGAT